MPYKCSIALGLCLVAIQSPVWAQLVDQTGQPQALFAQVKAATGGSRWDQIQEIDQQLADSQSGQARICMRYQDLREGRNATYCQPAGLGGSYGFDGRQSWFMDEKALVSENDSVQAKRDAVTEAYIARNGWFQAADKSDASMQYAGRQTDAGTSYEVVRITPHSGIAFDVWIDANAHRIDRIVEKTEQGTTQTTRYLDYRPTDGVLMPATQRVSESGQTLDEEIAVQQTSILAKTMDSHFAIPASKATDAFIVNHASSATVPFTLYAGYIMVKLSLGGSGPTPFLLDSGSVNLITPEAATKLGVSGKGQEYIGGVGATGEEAQIAHVDHYRLGDVLLKDQQFIVTKLPLILTDRGQQEPVAGLIGYEILRRFVTHIDYDHHTLTFTPLDTFRPPANARPVPLVFNDRMPQVEAKVDGAPGTFNLDTGDGGSLTLFASFVKTNGIAPVGPIAKTTTGGVGGVLVSNDARVASFSLGSFTLDQPRTAFVAPPHGLFASQLLAGNIGFGILSRFNLTLDYERHRLYLTKGEHFDQVADTTRSGLGLDRVTHDAFLVISVSAGSLAETAGLHVGDRITAINGRPSSQLGLQDIWVLSHRLQGQAFTLTVERDGVEKSYLITPDGPETAAP